MTSYTCYKTDYESAIGGYETVHGIVTVTFDIEPNSLDMAVAGSMNKDTDGERGFVYFVDQSLCKVRWLIEITD